MYFVGACHISRSLTTECPFYAKERRFSGTKAQYILHLLLSDAFLNAPRFAPCTRRRSIYALLPGERFIIQMSIDIRDRAAIEFSRRLIFNGRDRRARSPFPLPALPSIAMQQRALRALIIALSDSRRRILRRKLYQAIPSRCLIMPLIELYVFNASRYRVRDQLKNRAGRRIGRHQSATRDFCTGRGGEEGRERFGSFARSAV